MSIFGKLWDRIKDAGKGAVSMDPSPKHAAPTAAPTAGGTVSPSTASASVDVEAIMTNLETASGHKSNWRYSIVDLMSLLGMDNIRRIRFATKTDCHKYRHIPFFTKSFVAFKLSFLCNN